MNYARLPYKTLLDVLSAAEREVEGYRQALTKPMGRGERKADMRAAAQANEKLRRIRPEIEQRAQRPVVEPSVSDHALIRYLERGLNYDVEDLRQHILRPEVRAAIQAGVRDIPFENVVLRVENSMIVTVLERGQ